MKSIKTIKNQTVMKTNKMKTMKKQFLVKMACVAFALVSSITYAQNTNTETTTQRDGFIFEFVAGGGIISIEDSAGIQTFDKAQGTFVFPDLKFGYMLNQKLAITASLPGNIYEFQDNDRHFGGLIPSVQYWVKDNWWIHGGIGLAIDAQLKLTENQKLQAGYQFSTNDVAFTLQFDNEDDLEDNFKELVAETNNTHAVFGSYQYQTKKLNFIGGIRANYFSSVNQVFFEPRLYSEIQLSNTIKAKFSAELKNQSIYTMYI